MTVLSTCLYLHGFASSPSSIKAQYFAAKLSSYGINVLLPDLNGDDFADLSLSSQLQIIDSLLSSADVGNPAFIVGSSLGGLLATIAAERYCSTKAVVLLAPAFGLPRRLVELLGAEGLQSWRDSGYTEVFHHGRERMERLKYSFILDAEQYVTDNLKVKVPALVFHGQHDDTVPVAESLSFACNNPEQVELHLLESDHSLIDKLEEMWEATYSFLCRQALLLPGSPHKAG